MRIVFQIRNILDYDVESETDKWCRRCGRKAGRPIDPSGTETERVGDGVVEVDSRTGAGTGGGASIRFAGRGKGELVAAFVAAFGDAGVCRDYFGWNFHDVTDTCRYVPVLGFAGDRVGRVRGREKRGEND